MERIGGRVNVSKLVRGIETERQDLIDYIGRIEAINKDVEKAVMEDDPKLDNYLHLLKATITNAKQYTDQIGLKE